MDHLTQPQTHTKDNLSIAKIYFKMINTTDDGWFYCSEKDCHRAYTPAELLRKDAENYFSWAIAGEGSNMLYPLCPDHNVKMCFKVNTANKNKAAVKM